MRKISAWLLVFIVLTSGCSFDVAVLTPPASQPTAFQTQVVPSPVVTISATAQPISPTPWPTATSAFPLFYGASFTADPPAAQGNIFPAGTKQVFLSWMFQNMRADMKVKREWYLNDQLWMSREETWDMTKYGQNGTSQKDVSVYDFDAGLPIGNYELRMYIDNVIQPIGPAVNGQPDTKATFVIRNEEQFSAGYGSSDGYWGVEVYNNKRIVLKNAVTGETTQIYLAQEVPYVSWFPNNEHFLFVDRDRSDQKTGTTIGIRDHLWIVDVPSGQARRIYKSDTSFAGRNGPMASPDGRYIASLEGSGFGDACIVDSRLIFFEVAGDFNSAKVIKQQEFSGVPAFSDSSVYPLDDGYWLNANSFLVTLDGTCSAEKSKLGSFLFNAANRTAAQSTTTQQLVPGDLGWGAVHGKITNASTGAPIANAMVTCEHHSYTSSSLCAGSFTTNANGEYIFNTVFFHDTDTIKLTVQAEGYESREVSQPFFTLNDWEANIALSPKP